MACCGRGNKPLKPNGKVCPKCGWVMNRIHKYDSKTRLVSKYWLCSNKAYNVGGRTCEFKESI